MAKEKETLVRVFCEDGAGRMQLGTWPLGQRYDAYTWIDRLPDSMTYLSYNMMIPLDDGKQIVSITYDFNGDVDDLSQYDDQIKQLTEQVHITKAN